MTKVTQWVVGVVASVIVLAVAAVVTLTLLIDPNRFRGEIEARVRDATGRPFKIQGDLDVSWFPWLAVRMGAAQLGDPPLVQWESVRVGVRLIPLLKGKLVIDRVRVEGLQAHLRKTADGRTNWADLLKGGGSNNERPPPELAGLEVRDGTLEYVDESSGTNVRISKWDLDVGAWRPDAVVPVSTELQFEDVSQKKSLPTLNLKLETNVQFVSRSADSSSEGELSLRATQLSGRVLGVSLAADGIEFSLDMPQFRAVLTPLALTIPQWTLGVEGARLRGSVTADKQRDQLRARGPLSVSMPSARKFLTDLGISAPLPRDSDAMGALSLTTSWAYVDGAIALKPIALLIDDTSFTGELVRSNADEPTWTFDLRGDHIDLARYLITEDTSDEPFELPVDALRSLRAQGTVAFAQASFANTQMKNARLRVVLDDGRVETTR